MCISGRMNSSLNNNSNNLDEGRACEKFPGGLEGF